MQLSQLPHITGPLSHTDKMPLLFVGHGSPMNAIEQNEFARGWSSIGQQLPKPNAILCISAHWETKGTFITAMEKPKTIHDFYGFPKTLFDVAYPAAGDPLLAMETKNLIRQTDAQLDQAWGLDHGAWSVIKHMYPAADVPVLEMSMDYSKDPAWHYHLAKDLSALRNKGVLIMGSGNMVHNLGVLNWNSPQKGFDWAEEANGIFKKHILDNDHHPLLQYQSLGTAVRMSVPTPEHYLPLLYVLGLKEEKEQVTFFNDKTIFGSIAMTSLLVTE